MWWEAGAVDTRRGRDADPRAPFGAARKSIGGAPLSSVTLTSAVVRPRACLLHLVTP